ncbi:MAG TPA: DUF5335 family protein [Longimicrobium sp.]|nr:DUF5335 family protein [Longimicrobium sp.]
MDTGTARAEWAALVRDFTRRNEGRRTRLEIDDPELGAQWQEVDLPLRGVDFDPRDGSVEIFVGAPDGPRLSHRVAGVTEIDVQRGGGADRTLRVAHGTGQTLLLLGD